MDINLRTIVLRDADAAVHVFPNGTITALANIMKDLGFGRDYRYAHDEPDAYAAGEKYFPDAMPQHTYYYRPVPRGLEIKIAEAMARLRKK